MLASAVLISACLTSLRAQQPLSAATFGARCGECDCVAGCARAKSRAVRVASGVLTLAELLARLDWTPPDLTGVEVVAQPHCHQSSILGWSADEALLKRAGAIVTRVPGCCGLAGNFGMEKGHYEVSVAVAETHLLPAVREQPDAVVLADGMSCRVQLDDLAGVPAMHLAELLASKLGG